MPSRDPNSEAPRRRASVAGSAFALLAFSVLIYAASISRHPTWTPDGYDYTVRMLIDRGLPMPEARAIAQRFYATLPVGHDPHFSHLFRGNGLPEYWSLFAPRLVYPYAASLLYPSRGFQAMLDVSGLAYIVCVLLMFFVLMEFCTPAPAVAAAIIFALLPGTRSAAGSALTDMTALMFLLVCLLSLCRLARGGHLAWLLAFGLGSILLTFTRPITYIVLGAAGGFVWSAFLRRDGAQLRRATFCALVSSIWIIWLALFARSAHMPGAGFLIADYRRSLFESPSQPALGKSFVTRIKERLLHLSPSDSISIFYIKVVVDLVLREVFRAIVTIFPLIGVFGLVRVRRDGPFYVLLFGALAACLTLFVDLNPGDLDRTFEPTIYPILMVGIAAVLTPVFTATAKRFR